MALVHEFENSGNWLFKRRSWLPVFMIAAGIAMMYLGNRQAILFDSRDELIFLGVSFLGQLIRILTVGFTPKNTSGRNTINGQLADELNVTGIYSLVRHPLYLGNFFMWLGPVLFIRSLGAVIVFVLIYWLYYERIMFAEEQFLRRKFGDIYDKWSENVGSFIPHSFKFIRQFCEYFCHFCNSRPFQKLFSFRTDISHRNVDMAFRWWWCDMAGSKNNPQEHKMA